MNHLNDEQIQNLLDGHLPVADRRELENHVRACAACRERLSQYEELYSNLAAAPEMTLSRGFTRRVVRQVRRQEIGEVQLGLMQLFFGVAGIILGINLLFYFYEWEKFVKIIGESGRSVAAFIPPLVESLRPPAIDVNPSTGWSALGVIVVLLLLAAIDRLVLQPRFRSSS